MSHLWPVIVAHHPTMLANVAEVAAMAWTWLTPPVRERIA